MENFSYHVGWIFNVVRRLKPPGLSLSLYFSLAKCFSQDVVRRVRARPPSP